jgi:hypothetical protein
MDLIHCTIGIYLDKYYWWIHIKYIYIYNS